MSCADLEVKHQTTTAYRPQSIGQADRLNGTVVALLRHYIEDDQQDEDLFVQPRTYAYSTQVQESTNTSSFEFLLSCMRTGRLLRRASTKAPTTP